jgi:hypothetical protein
MLLYRGHQRGGVARRIDFQRQRRRRRHRLAQARLERIEVGTSHVDGAEQVQRVAVGRHFEQRAAFGSGSWAERHQEQGEEDHYNRASHSIFIP